MTMSDISLKESKLFVSDEDLLKIWSIAFILFLSAVIVIMKPNNLLEGINTDINIEKGLKML